MLYSATEEEMQRDVYTGYYDTNKREQIICQKYVNKRKISGDLVLFLNTFV